MDINSVVAKYATKTEKGVEFNLKALANDADFRRLAVQEVISRITEQGVCVLIPSFEPVKKNHLGKFINELAMTAQMRTLVTGNIYNLHQLRVKPDNVMLLKQSFRSGNELKSQVQAIKDMGCHVSVLCLLTHSTTKLERFGQENDVATSAIVKTDEIHSV